MQSPKRWTVGSGSARKNEHVAVEAGSNQGHLGGSAKAQLSMEPCSLLSCQLVTDTVSLTSAFRYRSVRSRLNIGSECPVLGGMQAEKLRWASKLFTDEPFSGSQEGGGSPGATILCKIPSASAWSPASSPDLAVWLYLLR